MAMSRIASILTVCCCIAIAGGCAQRPPVESPGVVSTSARLAAPLVFLTRDGCAASGAMRANLEVALRALGMPAEYQLIDLATLSDSDPRSGYPTPTLLYANRDVFGMPEPPVPHPPAT